MKKGTPARNPWGEDIRKYYPGRDHPDDPDKEPKGNHYWKKWKKAEEERKKERENEKRNPWHELEARQRAKIYDENQKKIKEYERTGKTQYATCIYCLGTGKGKRQITFGHPGHITPKCDNCLGKGRVPIPPGSEREPFSYPKYKNTVEETR